jgi:hypothetical protein
MADGFFPTLVSKDRNANASGNPLFVSVTAITPGVGATDLGKAEDAVHASGDTGVMSLAVRNDAGTSLVGTDGDYAPLQVNAIGELRVAASVTVNFTYDYAEDSAHVTADVGAFVLAVRQDTLVSSVDTDGDYGALKINAIGALYTTINSHALTNANAVPISKNNAANAESNPIFVQVVDTLVLASEIHSYDTTASVAGDGTDNHDYTVAGTTFLLKQVVFSCSGGGKVEVQTGPIASLVTIAVGFVPKHGGSFILPITPAREVPVTGTGTVRLIRTNRESSTQDVYSSIFGHDVA